MAKKLILCLDGTSNRYCRDNTNVVKLAALLDKDAVDQLLYYQPGIGTIPPPSVFSRIRKWFLTRIDLAFAILLDGHVQDAYRFLMRYYETGDEIFIFGFSRGAYTARVLAGMLCKVGLLARGNEELVPFAWARYANHEEEEKDPQEKKRKIRETAGFRNTFSRAVRVDLLGLWDTVSSVRYAWRDQHFPFTFDNPIVEKVRHAVALDERRAYFRQNLWKDPPGRAGQDVLQVWFPGVHCDVGGGYEEKDSGLAKIALKWMVEEIGVALRFSPDELQKVLPVVSSQDYSAPDAGARIHESLRGPWWLVEVIPKRVQVKQVDGSWKGQWIIPRAHRRWVAGDAKVHASVLERMALKSEYRPPNLPVTAIRIGGAAGSSTKAETGAPRAA